MEHSKPAPEENHYKVLGVRTDATPEQIEEAYFELARKLHPDVADGGEEAQARFMLINQAYQTLISEKDRAEYDKAIGVAPDDDAAAAKKKERRAGLAQRVDADLKKALKSAKVLCRQGDFWRASDMLGRLLAKYPRQPALRRALAEAAAGRFRYHEAADHLKVACEVEYFNAENHLLLGRMYRRGKQYQRARNALRDALSWDEDNEEARRELDEIREEVEGKSILKKIIGLVKGRRPGGRG